MTDRRGELLLPKIEHSFYTQGGSATAGGLNA